MLADALPWLVPFIVGAGWLIFKVRKDRFWRDEAALKKQIDDAVKKRTEEEQAAKEKHAEEKKQVEQKTSGPLNTDDARQLILEAEREWEESLRSS